jgi:hypothetical protein
MTLAQSVKTQTEKKQVIHPLRVIGNMLSKVSMSLENLFKIRPTGVTSKNVVQGTRKMFDSSRW